MTQQPEVEPDQQVLETMKRRVTIPIYRVHLWIVVDRNIYDLRREMCDIFGEYTDEDNWMGMCSRQGPNFGLFFDSAYLDTQTVAHEVFNLTHRILEWANVKFSPEDHEAAALLHGFLMRIVVKSVPRRRKA